MGRNYAENSLKKFLKRKVKITMGVVVSFLITGVVAFGAEPQEPTINADGAYIPYNKWTQGIGKTEEILKDDIIFDGKVVLPAKDINYLSKYMGEEVKVLVKNSVFLMKNATSSKATGENNIISDILPENYTSGLKYKDNVGNSLIADGEGKYSVIEAGTTSSNKVVVESEGKGKWKTGQYAKNGGIIINKGIIDVKKDGEEPQVFGQQVDDGSAINYGIIRTNGIGAQRGNNLYNYGVLINANGNTQIGAYLYNYGIIASNNARAQSGSVEVKNYGVLMNTKGEAQYVGADSEAYNYGLIANDSKGQYLLNGGIGYNYGVINSKKEGQYAQTTKTDYKNSLAENYGIINVEDKGQVAQQNSKVYNYGIIHSDKIAQSAVENSAAYNYGVLYNHEEHILHTPDYGGDEQSHNYGILITEGEEPFKTIGQKDELVNNGIVLKRSGANLSVFKFEKNVIDKYGSAVEYTSGKIESGTGDKSNDVFINNLNSTQKTVTEIADKLENTHITTAVTNDVGTVIKKDGDLNLTDSSIVGYFEKDGTLLEVNGDLTLSGESVINAIAGNEYTGYKGNALNNVVAVKLSDNGTLTIEENSKVLGLVQGNGIAVLKNSKEYHNNGFDTKGLDIKTTEEKGTKTTIDNLKVTEGVLISGDKTSKENTKITFGNNINIIGGISFNEHGTGGGIGADITLGDGQTSSDKTISIDSITLGTESDILTINNALKEVGVIDGKDGDDIVNLKNLTGTHDTFDYQLKNIETLDLNNQTWKIGAKADISFDNGVTKAGDKTTIQNGTLMGELEGTVKDGADFVNNEAVNKVIGNSTFGDNAKFQIGIGKDMELVAGGEYDIADTTVNNLKDNVGEKNITASAIFTKATEQGKDIRVKSAKEMNIDERYSGIYEEMLENASSNSEILNVLNSTDVSSIANAINEKGALGDTLATTGYKITRDISNSFMSAVNEWGKKANKGEWLANAKYINSDVEYDGANKVKGYDSDIKSMVGMIEYGVSDNTSLGIALGGGDTEIDVKDAGTLKGDNYYIGAYAKHSVNGFDLTGNLGYTISDLEVNGKGSADSSAITLGGYIKRDIALTETVRLEPNLSFTYDYIMQDNAEGNGVKVDNKDVHVFEAGAGMNIVKGFNFEKGVLELEAGVKYSMADVNRNEETVISVYGIDDINLGNPEVDKTRGTAHVGFDYEHETGFGVNGKYEMMWSDSGDDSRITAGISYRF